MKYTYGGVGKSIQNKNRNETFWIGFICLRIGTGGGLL
jgi:hypothetical protein